MRSAACAIGLVLLTGPVWLAGCGADTTVTEQPIQVAISYPAYRDVDENFPSLKIMNDPPQVTGHIRKTAAKRDIGGLVYFGETMEVTKVRGYGVPGDLLLEVVARRFKEAPAHIDIHVTSTMQWQLIISTFIGGRVEDVPSGKTVDPPYVFGPGTYHLKAYR
jgi:hypothetical protein